MLRCHWCGSAEGPFELFVKDTTGRQEVQCKNIVDCIASMEDSDFDFNPDEPDIELAQALDERMEGEL
jgi:hypothetical protein